MDFREKLAGARTVPGLFEALVAEILRGTPDASIHLMPLGPAAGPADGSVLHLRDRDPDEHRAGLALAVQALNTELPVPNLFEEPGRKLRVERCVGWERWRRSRVYQEHFRPLDTARQLVVGLVDPSGMPRAFAAVCRGEDDEAFTAEDERRICELRDQAERALGAFSVRDDWGSPADEILDALAVSLPVPAILIESSGRIAWMNQEAEIRLGLVAFAVGSRKAYGGRAGPIKDLVIHARRELERPGSSLARADRPLSWLRPGETLVVRRLPASAGVPDRALVTLIPTVAPGAGPPTGAPPASATSPEPIMAELGLTARQAEVAVLAAKGYSVVNIAHQLGIGESTVKAHLRGVYQKLGVTSRAELAWLLSSRQNRPGPS